jgi:hypothetical protein
MGRFRTIRKYLFNFLWVILVAAILLAITGYFLINKYEDEIKEMSISQINEIVQTKISVDEIDIAFLRTFPFISVVFQDVIVWSSHNFNRNEFPLLDTEKLFTAEKVYLKFNAIDLLRSNIRISRIYSVNGRANILIDSRGRTNAQVLKRDSERGESRKDKVLELEALRISDYKLSFNNLSKKTSSTSQIKNLLLKGKFSRSEFSLGTHAQLVLNDFTRNGFRYANDYDMNLRFIIQVSDSLASIEKGELSLNTMNLETTGNFTVEEKPLLNLSLNGRNINMSTLLSSFPDEIENKIPFDMEGRGDLSVKVNGNISSVVVPEIKAVYVLNLDKVIFEEEEVRNVRLKGKYTNGKQRRPSSTEIDVQKFKVSDFDSEFEGSFRILNLVKPDIYLKLSGEVDAKQLSDMLINADNFSMKGKLYPDLEMTSGVSSFGEINVENLAMAVLTGNLDVESLDMEFAGKHRIDDLNGSIAFTGDSWFPEINFKSNRDELKLKARMDHVLSFLLNKNQTLWVSGVLSGTSLDLNSFIGSNGAKNGSPERGLKLPERIAGNMELQFDEFQAGKLDVYDFQTNLIYRRKKINLDALGFRFGEGFLNSDAAIVQSENGDFYLKTTNIVKQIGIDKLFATFNNFGQNSLKAQHLDGLLTGNIEFNAIFDSSFSIKTEKILTEADIEITEGELNNFKPAERLSDFVDIKELSNIRFSTLKNNILIKNGKMTIPEMDINSNAFNIKLSGQHQFKSYFDYKVKILLSEILTGRSKVKNEDYYIMEDDRRASLYLTISGTAEDYEIRYDKKEALTAIKEDMQKEKKVLKTILNEEFGWFGKDVEKNATNQESADFVIEWEEDSTKLEKKESEDKRKKKKRRKKKKDEEEEIFELEWEDDG